MTFNMKGLNVSDPWTVVTIAIGAYIAVKLAVVFIPLLIGVFAELAGIPNFTFSSLFADDGMVEVIVGAIFLFGILGVLGMKKSQR